MKAWGITDAGLVRPDNQDSYAIEYVPRSGHLIAVVCDGMGGATNGRMASSMASEAFVSSLVPLLRADMTPQQLEQASSYCVAQANKAVFEKAQGDANYAGMGTTLVAAVAYAGGVVVSNVGDSRAYHICADSIKRISKDHSFVESLVDRGDITEEEARTHPSRNLITRAIGPDERADSDGYIVPLAQGDCVLLCSDGLVNTLTGSEMFDIIHQSADKGACMEQLLALSKDRGAPDNVTAVLVYNE